MQKMNIKRILNSWVCILLKVLGSMSRVILSGMDQEAFKFVLPGDVWPATQRLRGMEVILEATAISLSYPSTSPPGAVLTSPLITCKGKQ